MRPNSHIARRIAAACVVATGIAIAWGIAIGWLGLIASSLSPARDRAFDALLVHVDGTLVISTTRYSGRTSMVTDQRTLDGRPWSEKEQNWLTSAYFPKPYQRPGVFDVPQPWDVGHGRVEGAIDEVTPPAIWWFVRDDERVGGVYVAGYDGISKLPLGFIGRNGFRATKPPLEEQFIVPRSDSYEGFGNLILSNENLTYRRLPYIYRGYSGQNINRVLYLLGIDQLLEIDLGERSVRSWLQSDGYLAIGQVITTKNAVNPMPVQMKVTKRQFASKEVNEAREKSEKALAERAAKGEVITTGIWAIRKADRIVMFDLWDGRQQEFMLPEKLRDRRMSVFLTGPNEMLIDAHEQDEEFWSGGPIVRLFWINPQGQVLREQEVRLAGPVPPSKRAVVRRLALVVPVSIVWILGLLFGAPIAVLQANIVADYAGALTYAADIAWPPMVVVLSIGAALAWLTIRQQRKYKRSASAVWAAFVFLFGIAGYVTYLIEHRRPKLEACPKCGEIVPRDRDICAACNTEFGPPPRVGAEIFA
jgi:hypothetical protein